MFESIQEAHVAFPHFFTGVFFALGAVVGSFLNVCILRIPRGESVVFPGSHCACGKAIPLWNNIPIFSWFILRGRASCCGRKFSVRYAAIEAFTAVLFALSWQFLPWQSALAAMVFCAFAIVLAFIDWDTMFLPDSVNASFVLAGLACSFALPEIHSGNVPAEMPRVLAGLRDGFVPALVGMCVGSSLAYWFRYFASLVMRREAMGEGDVILLGGIGAFCGWQGAVFAFFASSFFGLFAVALGKIFGRKIPAGERFREASRLSMEGDDEAAEIACASISRPFPLGPWLLLGAAVYWAFGEKIVATVFAKL